MTLIADHKAWIAAHFRAHPSLIRDIYGQDPANEPEHSSFVDQAVLDAQQPGKWRLEGKWRAGQYFSEYGGTSRQADGREAVDYHDGARLARLPAAGILVVRQFSLDPARYDGAVAYLVLEAADGKWYLGAYAGD